MTTKQVDQVFSFIKHRVPEFIQSFRQNMGTIEIAHDKLDAFHSASSALNFSFCGLFHQEIINGNRSFDMKNLFFTFVTNYHYHLSESENVDEYCEHIIRDCISKIDPDKFHFDLIRFLPKSSSYDHLSKEDISKLEFMGLVEAIRKGQINYGRNKDYIFAFDWGDRHVDFIYKGSGCEFKHDDCLPWPCNASCGEEIHSWEMGSNGLNFAENILIHYGIDYSG